MRYKTLMEAQMGEYPDSVVLTDSQMLDLLHTAQPDWLVGWSIKSMPEVEVEHHRAQWARGAFMCRTTYPDGFFYACGKRDDGTYRHVGFRYGLEDCEYMSGFVGLTYTPEGEKQMKKYLVMAVHANGDSETVAEGISTKEEAERILLQCQEGDDKHDPCEYEIEEMGESKSEVKSVKPDSVEQEMWDKLTPREQKWLCKHEDFHKQCLIYARVMEMKGESK